MKLPVGGPTAAQLEAVRQIETEDIGCKAGAFGLHDRKALAGEVDAPKPAEQASVGAVSLNGLFGGGRVTVMPPKAKKK